MEIKIKTFMLLIIFILECIFCQQYEIPPFTQQNDKNIRLNSIQYLNEPKAITLNKIYRRQVYQVADVPDDTNTSMNKFFLTCQQSPPEINFKNIGYYHLDQISNPYWKNQSVTDSTQPSRRTERIIYDFEVLKSKYKNIVDMVFYDNHIFTISSTAVINIYKLNSGTENEIQPISTVKGIDWQLLNKKRMQDWQQGQNEQKQRLRQIQEQNEKQKKLQKEQKNANQTLLGDHLTQDNRTNLIGNDEKPQKDIGSNNKTKSSNLTSNSNKSRILQQTKPLGQQQVMDNSSQPQYYTVPPPQPVVSYLSKGYFQFLDEHRLLIFSNNQYLIGMDVKTFKPILLSQQIQYVELFKKIIQEKNQTNSNSTSNKTDSNNSTQKINTEQTKKLSANQTSSNNTSSNQKAQPPIIGIKKPIFMEYVTLQNFQDITKIDQKHFAVLDKRRGVIIYELIRRKPMQNYTQQAYYIEKKDFIDKQAFGKSYRQNQQMQLVDVQYNKNKSLLILLDYQKGIFVFDKKSKKIMNQQKDTFTLSPSTILKKMCNLMQFSQISQTLYLSCNKIHRISLMRWPRIQEKTFTHPLINIREIFVEQQKNIFILAGYSVFKVIYLDRTTDYFQDDMLDKIIFQKDLVITANQNHIIALRYGIQKPMIVCQPKDRSQLGVHNLVLRTTAQCSVPYLKSINFTKPYEQQSFDSSDVCVYTVYKNIYVWQQGQVPIKPLAIILLVFSIFLVVMIIWFVLVKFRMQRAQQHLKYLGEQGHKELVEEDVGSQRDSDLKTTSNKTQSDKSQQLKKQTQQISKDQQDPNKDLYSIQ